MPQLCVCFCFVFLFYFGFLYPHRESQGVETLFPRLRQHVSHQPSIFPHVQLEELRVPRGRRADLSGRRGPHGAQAVHRSVCRGKGRKARRRKLEKPSLSAISVVCLAHSSPPRTALAGRRRRLRIRRRRRVVWKKECSAIVQSSWRLNLCGGMRCRGFM